MPGRKEASSSMTTAGGVIEIDRREVKTAVNRASDHGGQIVFMEPLLHFRGGPVEDPGGGVEPVGKLLQSVDGATPVGSGALLNLQGKAGSVEVLPEFIHPKDGRCGKPM